MNMKAPKPKRNEQMTLSQKKYFANFVKSGASYKSFAFEYLRIFKKSTSRSTYHRIKKNADSILGLVTHRTKNATYNRKIDDELKQFERHCRTVIIKCHQRRFAIRLNTTAVAQVMQNEAEKFDFPWLKKMQFHSDYVVRFMKEYDLIFSSKLFFFSKFREISENVSIFPVSIFPGELYKSIFQVHILV